MRTSSWSPGRPSESSARATARCRESAFRSPPTSARTMRPEPSTSRRCPDEGRAMTVVHYLNQFFAGLGAEEAAGHEPVRIDGPVGPGRALAASGLEIDVTLACGDDRFGEREHE